MTPPRLLVAMLCLTPLATAQTAPQWLPASASKLPRWRGFNLTDKFYLGRHGPFQEKDFRLIRDLGFNFVRLPMDYRIWIVDGDRRQFKESELQEIDQAVRWGEQYGIHVMINFHRAPGYTVARPKEDPSIWEDEATLDDCCLHWATFAKRYAGIPNERVSFNLFNEPAHVSEERYVEVCRRVVAAIRAEDPNRLIVSDGMGYGAQPVMGLLDLGLAQATRGYAPGWLSHHQASWAGGTPNDPVPTWPRPKAYGMLYGAGKAGDGLHAPFPIEGPFAEQTELRLRVGTVSARAHLLVEADGVVVWEHDFVCGPGEGEWKEAVFAEQWNIWQNIYDRDYIATIPAGTKLVTIRIGEGDWMKVPELGLTPAGGQEVSIALSLDWGKLPAPVRWTGQTLEAAEMIDRQWLWDNYIVPWQAAEAAGIGVMVGEFGSFNKTPHDVVLRWMEDCLANWQEAGWGWAMWNFRGAFGILDSGRADVEYEEWEGHKLDRKLLDLIQRY